MYTQCKIQYENSSIGIAWIPTEFAKRNKSLIIGKKSSGDKAKVLEVWGTICYDISKDRREWNVGGL